MADKQTKEVLESVDTLNIEEKQPIVDAEWCFQFFDNEPIVFAYSNEGQTEAAPLVIQVQSKDGEALSFNQNGMEFRIFPRPISEETKLERAKLKENDIR
jgi:hypothetical protein